MKDFEVQVDRYRQEIAGLNHKLQSETRTRTDCQNQIDRLNENLNGRSDQLNRCAYDLDNATAKSDRLMEDNSKLFAEVDRLKNHTMLLTEQNQRVNKLL